MGILKSELSRTTSLIGELIALITQQEETLTFLGEETYKLYRARRIYDEVTLELCRKIDGTRQLIEEKRRELEDALDEGFGNTDKGARDQAKKIALGTLIKRELAQFEKMLRDDHDELGNRVIWLSKNDPRQLTARTLKMVATIEKLKRDIDWRWDELQERTRNEKKGPVFILVLNMFIVNFFKFTNHTWFRDWIRKFDMFQDKFMSKIRKEHQADLMLPEEELGPPPGPPPSREPEPVAPASDPFKSGVHPQAASPDPFAPPTPLAPPTEERSLRSLRAWKTDGHNKSPDYHGAPADAQGGFFGPGSNRANPFEDKPDET